MSTTFSARVRADVRARAGDCCERCGGPGTDFHHRKFKSRGGEDTAENAVLLCGRGNTSGCHQFAHTKPKAHDEGISIHSWVPDVSLVPYKTVAGWFKLTDAGRTRVAISPRTAHAMMERVLVA